MRTNGLTAADYAPVAVLEHWVAADALLALRDAGVAAYAVQPEPEETQRATLFADRTALDLARSVVRELAPEALPMKEVSAVDEVAWQQIVSGFASTAPEPGRDRSEDRLPPEPHRAPPEPHRPPPEPHPLVTPDEEHFVPEPPAPAPHLDWVSRLAWGGVFGGPLMLVAASLVSWAPPNALTLLCVVGFVGGILTLVLRMKDRPPNDSGPDDGAVV